MGRPRKHPVGTTATERVNASVDKLKLSGGARKTWRLSPEAHSALRVLMEATHAATETDIIERLLLERAAELRQSGSGSDAAVPSPDRIYLYVPFLERAKAEKAGAEWDKAVRRWYVTDQTDSHAVDRWRKPVTVADAERAFAAECKTAGLLLPVGPALDGKWHRCLVIGDKKREPSGMYRGTFAAAEGRGFGSIRNLTHPELSRGWRFDGGGAVLPRTTKSSRVKPAQTKPAAIPSDVSLPDLSSKEWQALLSEHVDLSATPPPTKRKAKAGG